MTHRCVTCGGLVFTQTNHDCVEHLKWEIGRLKDGIRGIRRELGHKRINNDTATLADFCDLLTHDSGR